MNACHFKKITLVGIIKIDDYYYFWMKNEDFGGKNPIFFRTGFVFFGKFSFSLLFLQDICVLTFFYSLCLVLFFFLSFLIDCLSLKCVLAKEERKGEQH